MLEYSDPATRAAATVGVGAAGTSYTYLGLPLSEIMGLATLAYLAIQIVSSVRKLIVDIRQGRSRHEQSH